MGLGLGDEVERVVAVRILKAFIVCLDSMLWKMRKKPWKLFSLLGFKGLRVCNGCVLFSYNDEEL